MTIEQFINAALIGNKTILIYCFNDFLPIKSVKDFTKRNINNFVYSGKEYKVVDDEIKPC